MNHDEIIEAANARQWDVITPDGGKITGAKIYGARLDYPSVSAARGLITFPISWHLAERLATGQSVRVLA